MTIPKKLKIGAHIVNIDTSQKLSERNGEWDAETNTIRICSSISKTRQEETLLHEIFHVLNCEFTSETVWHAFMDSLSGQLYQVLKENKLLK